jgi:acetolactate synthase-1/2/3 large subunit
MGKGAIPENHPLSLGITGMHGTVASNRLILEADVVLAVGMRFSDRTTGRLDGFCPDAKIIHFDIDSAEVGKNLRPYTHVVADAKKALQATYYQMVEAYRKKERSTWMSRVQELKREQEEMVEAKDGLSPPHLMTELRKVLPVDSIVTTEVGQNQMWAALHLKAYGPRNFITSGGLGTMGFGFPAALGAKVARPGVPVVDVAGDGSFLMTEQDLATSVMEGIPVTVIVLNNSVLGMVAQWQRLFYGKRYSQVKLGKVPDFVKLAEAYGAQGIRVDSVEGFLGAVRAALRSEVTTVIDVPISPEEDVFPMVPAGSSLKDMIAG